MSQRAYINGFVKRAAEYGISMCDAMHILKYANDPNYHAGPGGSVFAPRQPLGQSDKSLAIAGTQTYAGPGGSVFAPRQSAEPSNFAPRQSAEPSNRSLAVSGTQNLQGPGSSAFGARMNTSPRQPNLPNLTNSSMPQITQPTTPTPKAEITNKGLKLREESISFPASLP